MIEGLAPATDAQPAPMGHQARKALATRERILLAVIELINESGLAGATSSQIARRAGITWGAVQHHFGNKEEILLAVLYRAQEIYLKTLSHAKLGEGKVEERIHRFVELVWEHYRSDLYFAFSEILRASHLSSNGSVSEPFSVSEQQEKHVRIMATIFDGYPIPRSALKDSFRFVHRFMAGFAIDRILEPSAPFEANHIERVKDELFQLTLRYPQEERPAVSSIGGL